LLEFQESQARTCPKMTYMYVCKHSSLGENVDMAEYLRRRVEDAVLWAGFEYPCDSNSSFMAQLVFRTQGHKHKTGVPAALFVQCSQAEPEKRKSLGQSLRYF
jgi:hypothetical protein